VHDESDPGHEWLDDEAGPVVRPYAVTGGRTKHARQFDVVAFVVATGRHGSGHLQPEHRRVLERAVEPVSVAEVAAHVDLPLGVVRVLLSDLLADELIVVHEPDGAHRPAENVLEAVINGLRSL
jgi:hypothetical protein